MGVTVTVQLAVVWCVVVSVQPALVPLNVSAPVPANHEEISSPLRVAQCRARCLQKFSGDRDASCLQGADCFMCWENCALLQSNFPVWGAMCSEKRICFPGCQQACRFHRETSGRTQQTEPVIQTRGEEVLNVEAQGNGGIAYWRAPLPPRHRHVVYVLMAKPKGAETWSQISQGVQCEAKLEASSPLLSSDTTVRVLVVDPEGLVTMYSPALARPVSSVAPPTTPPLQASTVATKEVWKVHAVSLLHQRVLVIAEVAWTPRARRGVYLVTWEVDGGGLRGNLFTDSTSVTLSLWPDTIYHIQVELVSRGAGHKRPTVERSEPLLIDTHKAPQVESRPPPPPPAVVAEPWGRETPVELQQEAPRNRRELLAGTGAAMLLFLIVSTAMAWRCHRARSLGRNKRSLLLADDSISAGSSQPVVSTIASKACKSCPQVPPQVPSIHTLARLQTV